MIIIRLSRVGGFFLKKHPKVFKMVFQGILFLTSFGEKSDFRQESMVFQAKNLLTIFQKSF